MLNEFRSTNITWDKATSRIYSPVTANESDENGRKLVVQIVNSGQVEDLTGATLHLYWETRDKAHIGLDVFKAVDLKKGEFELSYTTGMLSNHGVLNANLVLIDTVGRVVSERFKITVTEGIDDDAIQSENSFSSLTQALIDVGPRLNDLTAQLQQKVTKGSGTLSDFNEETRAAIQGIQPTEINAVLGDGNVTPANTNFMFELSSEQVTEEVDIVSTFQRNDGYFINVDTGVVTVNASYCYFDYVPIDENTSLFNAWLNSPTITTFAMVAFYSEKTNESFISGYQPVASDVEKEPYKSYSGVYYTIPTNAKYARFSVPLSRLSPNITILFKVRTVWKPTKTTIPSLDLNNRVKSLEDGYSGGGVLSNKKIVNFGDSIFGNYRDTGEADKSISKMISERTGATVYNAGFGGCRMATHSNFWDAFSMHSLADSIATGNWEKQDQALIAGSGTLPSYFSETLSMLKTIVWSDVDIITIGYGTNDYSGNIFIEHNAAFQEWDYFKGALKYSIDKILSAHQHIKIVVLSPMWRWFLSDGVFAYDSDDAELSKNTRGHILPDYVSACEEIARECHVLYLDNYYSLGINKYNHLEYFPPTDGTHPNLSGRELRANRIASQVIANI